MKMFYAVSVPYGDLFYFYWNSAILQSQIKIVSVPYGDLFYFYIHIFGLNSVMGWFPSPMGIFFISIKCESNGNLFILWVSVPYGDLFYFY